MVDISIGIVIVFIIIVLVRAYSPLWSKDDVTLLITDDELLQLFPDEAPLRLSELIAKVYGTHGVLPGSSEMAARLGAMVKSGQLQASPVSENRENGFDDNEEGFDNKILLYSRVFE